jgi:hypothetical protein
MYIAQATIPLDSPKAPVKSVVEKGKKKVASINSALQK